MAYLPPRHLPLESPAPLRAIYVPAGKRRFTHIGSGPSRVDERQERGGFFPHERLTRTRFHVQAHERLGVGTAEIEAPIAEFHGQAVGKIERLRLRFIVFLR